MIRVGDIAVHRVVESEIPFYRPSDLFAQATPQAVAPYRPWLEPKALCPRTGRLVMPVQSYLVRTRRHCILLDTCVGCNKTGVDPSAWHRQDNQLWLARLAAAGARPDEIDFVFCTHLHSDHCGWNTRMVDGRWVPTFPRARYICSREEYQASEAGGGAVHAESVLPLLEARQLTPVAMDFALDDHLRLEPATGHTAGHVVVHLRSGGCHAIMCGDLMHSPLQLAEPDWSCTSDHDPIEAAITRRSFIDAHCDAGTLILTAHFPSPSMGRIVRRDGRHDFRYLAAD